MSSFYGLWQRDGQPIDPEETESFKQKFAWWHPDRTEIRLQHDLLIGQAILWNTPQSKRELLPLKNETSILAMDGRIDNRDELAKTLRLHDHTDEIGDARIVLAAYERWREKCLTRLVGEFAFVLWDARKQRLLLARDFIGTKPIYYFRQGKRLLFANDLKGILKLLPTSLETDTEALADYLVNRLLTDQKRTFFRYLHKIEPGTYLLVSRQTEHTVRYWDPASIPVDRTLRKEEAVERLRFLLQRAVSDRLRSDYPISSHLSGGLDSSPIAVIASRMMTDRPLQTYGWIHPPKSREERRHVEWNHALSIARRENIRHRFVSLETKTLRNYLHTIGLSLDWSDLWYEYPIREAIRRSGSRTLLSGWGGDEFISYHGNSVLAELLGRGRFVRLATELTALSRRSATIYPLYLKILYTNLILPFVPRSLYCRMPKTSCGILNENLLNDPLKSAVSTLLKKKRSLMPRQPARTVREAMIRALQNGHIPGRMEAWHNASFAYRFRYAYALLDRRIVELALRLPGECYLRNGTGRYLYREAVKPFLPDEVIQKNFKREPHRIDRIRSMYTQIFSEMDFPESCSVFFDRQSLKTLISQPENIPYYYHFMRLCYL